MSSGSGQSASDVVGKQHVPSNMFACETKIESMSSSISVSW